MLESNLLVLCPNHHAMFDRGALFIEPQSLLVHHSRRAIESRPLFIHDWHKLNLEYIHYHQEKIYCPA